MDLSTAFLIAFTGTILAGVLIIAIKWTWDHLTAWATRHVERMTRDAIARPIPFPIRDWDAEMAQLVAEEQDRH